MTSGTHADRHKAPPQSVRMPAALLAWYREYAGEQRRPLNAVLVEALADWAAARRLEPEHG